MVDLSLGLASLVLSAFLIALGHRWKGLLIILARRVTPKHWQGAGPGAGHSMQMAHRDVAGALEDSGKRIMLIYGSQTGTAEDFAGRLSRQCKRTFGESGLLIDPEDYDLGTLGQVPADMLVIFLIATHGEGEPTENAAGMLEELQDWTTEPAEHSLSNLHYAVFCLGNKTYEHYCAAGRRVDELLLALGAIRVGERGEGDADKTLEEDFTSWQETLLETMRTSLGFENTTLQQTSDLQITEHELDSIDKSKLELGLVHKALHGASRPHPATPISIRELFASGERSCIFAEFELEGSRLTYQAGDHLGVWSTNPEDEVWRALRVFGLDSKSETIITINSLDPASVKVPFPTPTTILTAFRYYLDITAPVTRQLCQSLAAFTEPGSRAAQELSRWGSDKVSFLKEVEPRCLTVSQLLLHANAEDYTVTNTGTTWTIPLEWIIGTLPRLQPRFYSISSSPRLNPNTVQITAVVLRYCPAITPSSQLQHVHGTTSNYLLRMFLRSNGDEPANLPRYQNVPAYHLAPQNKVSIFTRPSSFRLPVDPRIPVIMIGPGTGVAPFRSFLQDRLALARKNSKTGHSISDWGHMLLFYGCRSAETDFLYREEWDSMAAELNGRFRMFTAYSRSESAPRQYVTDLLRLQSDLVCSLVNDHKGVIYICGATNMSADVKEVLNEILASGKGTTKPTDRLQNEKRLRLDVW